MSENVNEKFQFMSLICEVIIHEELKVKILWSNLRNQKFAWNNVALDLKNILKFFKKIFYKKNMKLKNKVRR